MLVQYPDTPYKHTQILSNIGLNCIILLRLCSNVQETMTLLKKGTEKEDNTVLLVEFLLTMICMSHWMQEWYTRLLKYLKNENKKNPCILEFEQYLIERNLAKCCLMLALFRL